MLVAALAALLTCSAPLAQQPSRPPQPRVQQQPPDIGGAGLLQGQQPGGQQPDQQPQGDEFGSIWGTALPHQFDGFPTFPSRLRGYGNYPLPVDPAAAAGGAGPDLQTLSPGALLPLLQAGGAPVAARQPDWPDWVHAQQKQPLPFAPDKALLVRQVDRVWWRSSAAEPFVPLHFHDKFTTLDVGGEVEVRQVGQFELLLHESTRVETRGPTRATIVRLSEQQVCLAFSALTWVRLHVTSRAHEISLPDGSVLQIAAAAPAAAANPLAMMLQGQGGGAGEPVAEAGVTRPAWLEIARAEEPGVYGGRATITNFGDRDVTWRHAFGEVVLHHGERVTVLLTPPARTIAAGLQPAASNWRNQDGVVTCRADAATEVGWCGAQIALPAGTTVRFESLQGDAFEPLAKPPVADPVTGGAAEPAKRGG